MSTTRDILFLSKATPKDDAFALWLAPRLEAAGYRIFADILELQAGGDWRERLTRTLNDRAIKFLLCCSDATLAKRGVRDEIAMAEALSKKLDDPQFIIPLRLQPFEMVFGISGMQYLDFEDGWARGLARLLKALDKQKVPKAGDGSVQPAWGAYLRREAKDIERAPETLTTNWLRLLSMPDTLHYLVPRNRASESQLRALGASFVFPLVQFGAGYLGFTRPIEMEEHFLSIGRFRLRAEIDMASFMNLGCPALNIHSRDARNITANLLRQAWEKHCTAQGFFARQFSKGLSFHVGEDKLKLGQRVAWGHQGDRRNSMLRNIAKKRIWEYGVSASPSLFPFPHMRLKGRVLFSDIGEHNKPIAIPDKRTQFRLRRSICSAWRNKAWRGRVMAFMELLAGESPYVDLPVSLSESIILDAMPIQVTSPVTTRIDDISDEDAEEQDLSTLGGGFGLEEDDL